MADAEHATTSAGLLGTATADEIVVDDSHRKEGYGTRLVKFVEEWAKENDCEYVALASPLAKDDVHQFYEDSDYEKWGYVIEKQL
ncbi:GNAT family N-acetyltransferase [Natrarchaeobius chitinivorans]|uniref:GNAT family N-acetyltransferase n=1 Tax=Natrarchaeobius chitinivorans TaxID=1679083 RepID=UPI0024372953|nr:GNAT family N-acetyltransferase [Natrarchaeobius chitinivorans]